MGDVYFYHLTRRSVVDTLGALLPRCLSQGWRVAVRCGDPARIAWLDEKLWLGPPDSFLPHGVAGGDYDARQPILLTPDQAANDPHCVMSVDGAEITAAEVAPLARACILFDGLDGEALARARSQWTTLTGAGVGARYWSEESGKWEEKATKNIA
ncbi:DNA polymerase III subunit chi [Jannaschia pagri]|uniref:DNA polymerase III subunit chi n=1 Tax=Jannaschia pagri TaxID=2829797 RepID=A0ABQ4NGY0_9RHOB|nr:MULTISPECIES: DNA polymerase III subunit chi [unclassified Jannaschia]GIT90431.1 DNA polymerase III subunit chi [Jannaschia sp. AI_61]GIT93464.1 DNA polymerase III subunit chi [Jannaschia sp. AI_62]